MDDARYDCAVAAAALILNSLDDAASKAELMSVVTFIVLEAIKTYEAEREISFSAN